MIVVELTAGLGNQLFQYAHAKALSVKLKQDLYFDLSFFERWNDDVYRLDSFNTIVKQASEEDINKLKRRLKKPDLYRKIIRRFGFSPYSNSQFHFDNERIDNTSVELLKEYPNLYISGYYADQKYFIDIEPVLRKEFTLKQGFNKENKVFENKIKSSNSVSLHIRRGDYVNNPFFANIPLEYYKKAMDYILGKNRDSVFFVFSDDLNWVKNNLNYDAEIQYVDINSSKTDYMDLMLMASCKHNIIANSTFSWWGAWLNNNPGKIVIAPQIWYNNKEAQQLCSLGGLVPANWIKM